MFTKSGQNFLETIPCKAGVINGKNQVPAKTKSTANIAVFYVLRQVVYNVPDCPPYLLGIKRFVDDIAGLWTGSFQEFCSWSDSVDIELE